MRIETVPITTLDGLQLDGDLALVDHPRAQAVLCHPHPLYGGDRFDGVIDTLFAALPASGVTTLRFDFRGVNDSQGTHGGGDDERLDVAACLDLLGSLDAALPTWVVGYSFGALVGLNVTHPLIHGWVAVAPPLALAPGLARAAAPCLAASDHRPKHVVLARHDQFSPPDATLAVLDAWSHTTTSIIEMADHFLRGRYAEVSSTVISAIEE